MIVPALLTKDKEKMQEMIDICSNFAKLVQIDLMDGEFVPSRSITNSELSCLNLPVAAELHLMVEDPFRWIKTAKEIGIKRFIFHSETKINHTKLVAAVKKNNMEAGICLNPQTKLSKLNPLIERIDLVLFMSVNPGFYGAPFIPEVLDKIKKFKELWPGKTTAIDGGIKESNFLRVKNTGVNHICIGSAILKAENPKQAFAKFSGLLDV